MAQYIDFTTTQKHGFPMKCSEITVKENSEIYINIKPYHFIEKISIRLYGVGVKITTIF